MSQSPASPVLSVGDILSATFEVIGRNLLGFVLLAFVVYLAIVLLNSLFFLDQLQATLAFQLPSSGEPATGAQEGLSAVGIDPWAMLQGTLVGLLAQLLFIAIVAYGTECDWYGERASMGSLLRHAVRVLPTLALVAVIAFVPLAFGFLLFVIPGLVLLVFWWVVMPAAVLEGRSLSSFGRSRSLTKGARSKVLGLICILAFGSFGLGLAISLGSGFVMGLVLISAWPNDLAGPNGLVTTFIWINLGLNTFILMIAMIIFAVASTVTFLELRDLKEGDSPAAQVFD